MRVDRQVLIELTRECVLCGKCKATCPTYQSIWKEPYGPRGRMRLAEALLQGQLSPSQYLRRRLVSCTLCGACEKTCPKGVKVPWTMMAVRQNLGPHSLSDTMIKLALRHPRTAYKLARMLYPLAKKNLIKKGVVSDDSPLFEYPALEWGDVYPPKETLKPRGRVVLFSGCAVRFVFSYLAESLIKLCNEAGYEVVVPKGEACCGAPLLSMGMIKEATKMAKKNLQYLSALKADFTVSLCPTCTHTMRNLYPELLGQAVEIEDSVVVLQSILHEHGTGRLKGSVLYHHPCHSLYGLGIKDLPVQLLRSTGLMVTELPEGCCGFAGGFSLKFKDLSMELLRQRFAGINIESATVVTPCPGCIFQFMKVLPQGRVMHLVEIVEEALDENRGQKDQTG